MASVCDIDLGKLTKAPVEHRAYLAGFFDGEGSVGLGSSGSIITSRKTREKRELFRIYASVCQAAPDVLRMYQSYFGGNLKINNRKRTVNGREYDTAIYEWRVDGKNKVSLLLQWMLPYLIEKKEQAQIALEFSEIMHDVGRETLELYQSKIKAAREARRIGKIDLPNGRHHEKDVQLDDTARI